MNTFEVKEGEEIVLSLPTGIDVPIVSVVWQPNFFEVKDGLRGKDYVDAVNVSRETFASAQKEEGFTSLSDWFARNRTRKCFEGIGIRLEVCYLLRSGNLVAVNNLVGSRVAFTADESHQPVTLTQENELCRTIAKGDTTKAIMAFVNGTLRCTLSEKFYVFKKKDGTFSREFQQRTWTITAPTETK